jgi:hypothetical protein
LQSTSRNSLRIPVRRSQSLWGRAATSLPAWPGVATIPRRRDDTSPAGFVTADRTEQLQPARILEFVVPLLRIGLDGRSGSTEILQFAATSGSIERQGGRRYRTPQGHPHPEIERAARVKSQTTARHVGGGHPPRRTTRFCRSPRTSMSALNWRSGSTESAGRAASSADLRDVHHRRRLSHPAAG